MARLHAVVAIGRDQPLVFVVEPAQFADLGLEARQPVQVEGFPDALRMGADLRRERVFFPRNVAGLFEQRQVDVTLDVALRAGIAVPVPGAAEISALLDDTDALDPAAAQLRSRHQAAEAAADDKHVDFVIQRRPREPGLHIGIVDVVAKVALHLDILVIGVGPQARVALLSVFGAQCVGIEIEVKPGGDGIRQRSGIVRDVEAHGSLQSCSFLRRPLPAGMPPTKLQLRHRYVRPTRAVQGSVRGVFARQKHHQVHEGFQPMGNAGCIQISRCIGRRSYS